MDKFIPLVGGRLKIWFPSMEIGNSVYFLNKKLKNFALSFQKRYTPCGIESRVAILRLYELPKLFKYLI
jgi:hypothetical protein